MSKIRETPQYIVVWDPEGEYWDGGLVDRQRAQRLAARGVCVLPVVPDQFRSSSVGGYSKRAWGAGIPLDGVAPRMIAPLTIYLDPKIRGLVWRARLVPNNDNIKRYSGIVRMSADSGQRTPMKGSYHELTDQSVSLDKLGEPDAEGGWIVGGEGVTGVASEGHYGFSLYAVAPGLSVVWLAATSVPVEV